MDAVEFLISGPTPAQTSPRWARSRAAGNCRASSSRSRWRWRRRGGRQRSSSTKSTAAWAGRWRPAIGERLARLAAREGQLLAVTHSPQVAARGQQHYLIAKASSGVVTKTSVVLLDSAGRQEEIARMLSGAEVNARGARAGGSLAGGGCEMKLRDMFDLGGEAETT